MQRKQPVRSVIAGTVLVEPVVYLLIELFRWLTFLLLKLLLWPFKAAFANTAPEATGSAFITGCDTGIGREVALLLAQKGWRVFAGVLTEFGGQQLARDHTSIVPLLVDVTREDTITKAAQKVSAAVGDEGLQLLINNAGLMQLAPLECLDLSEVKKMLEVNVWGVFAVTQAILPLLRKGQRKGRIINMGSVSGHMPVPFWSAYVSTKHALEGLNDCLRYELLDQGIKVVLIKPGPVRTSLWEDLDHAKHYDTSSVLTTPEMDKLYGKDYAAMLHEADKAGVAAIPVSDVVQVIYEAATTTHPKAKYHVGPKAAAFHWLKRILPDEPYNAMMMKVLAGEYQRSEALRQQQVTCSSGTVLGYERGQPSK